MATRSSTSADKPKRNELTLKKKVLVIDYMNKNPGCGCRKVATMFGCGKTQVQSIILNKATIMAKFESNAPNEGKRSRKSDFPEVNEAVYK